MQKWEWSPSLINFTSLKNAPGPQGSSLAKASVGAPMLNCTGHLATQPCLWACHEVTMLLRSVPAINRGAPTSESLPICQPDDWHCDSPRLNEDRSGRKQKKLWPSYAIPKTLFSQFSAPSRQREHTANPPTPTKKQGLLGISEDSSGDTANQDTIHTPGLQSHDLP